MKIQKTVIASLIAILFIQVSFSQEFEMPKDLKLDTAEDYKKHEPNVIKCINWLENTPVNQNSDKRTDANAYLMLWITGSPTVTIEMQSFQMDLTEKNASLLMSFIGGWVKYAIENPTEKDNIQAGNVAGITSIIKVYSANKGDGMKKDKRIEKLMKLDQTELQEWVSGKLK